MRIYNEIVFDVDGKVIYEDSYEYSGDVIMFKGGDSPTTDPFAGGVASPTAVETAAEKHARLTSSIAELLQTGREDKFYTDEEIARIRELSEELPFGQGYSMFGGGIDVVNQQFYESQTPNVLQSLPSISNVGTVPFSGVVNWNAIPGGFQPLPQTAGGRKKLYQLSQFHGGMNEKSSPRDISDQECTSAINLTVSQVGRIKVLGDIKSTDNSITVNSRTDLSPVGGVTGYGLFQFTAPADQDGNVGEEVITLSADGDTLDPVSVGGGNDDAFIDYAGSADNHDVAHVIYAAGNGVYANDANFANASSDNPRKAKIYVYREDAGSSQTVSGWKEGKALIDSPTYDIAAAGSMAAGDVKVIHAAETASVAGTMIVDCTPTGAGTWDGTYYFYCSWLFDGGVETGLTSCGTDDGSGASDGIAFVAASTGQLGLNVSLMHTPHDSDNTELGGDKRIEGARIYFKKSTDTERFLLAELNMIDGVKGALDSTFSPWTESSDVYSHTTITFEDPPEVYTYSSLNGYYANEVYDVSADVHNDDTAGPTAHDVRYKTAVIGPQGNVFIGNVKFKGRHMPDTMMFSMPGKPGVFPKFNFFDSPSSDGSPIMALASFQDTILQFKENSMYVINISNPAQFYAEASFRDCGVSNPCQVFVTSFGVIFANKNGCFVYDGQKVISLTNGKFTIDDWGVTEGIAIADDTASVPCVGYDPRSQSIIVLKNIGDDSTNTSAWIYNMVTQSWTEGSGLITNANGNRHTNFIITSGGYLSILRDDSASLFNYNQGQASGNTQDITYTTKDLDFGLPSQTKKIMKVYITYTSGSNVPASDEMYFKVNGSGSIIQFASGTFQADQTNGVTTFVPTSAATGATSFQIIIAGATVDESFEINDISILYRPRPIK